MDNNSENLSDYSTNNILESKEEVFLEEYFEIYKTRITQDSEKLFVEEFLYPLLGHKNIKFVIPQYPFLDSEGSHKRIDFALVYNNIKIALEVNGETYHAEGIIPDDMFDNNLSRQNEILNAGWFLLRYSYSQLKSPIWRTRVSASLFRLVSKRIPQLISENIIKPNSLQTEALNALALYRKIGWKKGIVVLPTGTGKTFLSALDTLNTEGRILFIVHKLDILIQSREAFEKIYPEEILGILTGNIKENIDICKVLFASKDTLRNPNLLSTISPDEFSYIIIDEVHHAQSQSYQLILNHFKPKFFMLGLTATPDRMDRKDIFELFNYQKVFEYSLDQAITNGYLTPFTYYGLKDNVDYNNIRYNNSKYNITDLNRELTITGRNEKIYEEYLDKGKGDKALGFCCSIKHADIMANFFTNKGIPSISITSESQNRDELIKDFRENKFHIAFTVDLFNEGIDFPNLKVLLFLRPTESKTVFMQQLGRGLRLYSGKEKAIIIDFIGDYKKANNIRKYLAKNSTNIINQANGRVEKKEYEYTPKCEIKFEAEVEDILNKQDLYDHETTKEDLIDAYYNLAETLNRKPTQEDINTKGEFKIARYFGIFGGWVKFLKEVGEYTESSYHFPQGTHLGHIMYILNAVGSNSITGSHIAPEYVRLSGSFDSEENKGTFQRQTKYKLQAAMELGLLIDYRDEASINDFELALTNNGKRAYTLLKPLFSNIDFSFKVNDENRKSWTMNCEKNINSSIRSFLNINANAKIFLRTVFLEMDAVSLLLKYIYIFQKVENIKKSDIYADFFTAPFVREYLEINGIEQPSVEGVKHRLPFLINILDALGIVNQTRSHIQILSFIPAKKIMQFSSDRSEEEIDERVDKLRNYILTGIIGFSSDEISNLKETFGANFLTNDYHLKIEVI